MATEDLFFVREILKRFGTIIYTGNRLDDLVLMDLELQDLFEYKVITDEDYTKAKMILFKEKRELELQS